MYSLVKFIIVSPERFDQIDLKNLLLDKLKHSICPSNHLKILIHKDCERFSRPFFLYRGKKGAISGPLKIQVIISANPTKEVI